VALERKGDRLVSRNDVNQSSITDPLLKFIATKVLPITATRPGSAVYPQISTAIQTATENVVSGRSTPVQAAQQYEKALEKAVGGTSSVETGS
jgi:multiple sugar transport system substrate-binding protein